MTDPVSGPVEQEMRFALDLTVRDTRTGEIIIGALYRTSHSITVEQALRKAADALEARAEEHGYD